MHGAIRNWGLLLAGFCGVVGAQAKSKPKSPSVCRPGNSLRVMSMNLWNTDGSGRMNTIAQYMKTKARADLILVQEAICEKAPGVNCEKMNGDEAELTSNSTTHRLGQALGMDVRFQHRKKDFEGLAFLSATPISYATHKNLSESPVEPKWDRIAYLMETTHPKFGLVRAVNVHLTSADNDSATRVKQIQETLDFLKETEEERGPAAWTIVGGDFNAEPTTAEMNGFRAKWAALTRGRVRLDANTPDPTWDDVSPRGFGPLARRLDYLFAASAKPAGVFEERLYFGHQIPKAGSTSMTAVQMVWPTDHRSVVHDFYDCAN